MKMTGTTKTSRVPMKARNTSLTDCVKWGRSGRGRTSALKLHVLHGLDKAAASLAATSIRGLFFPPRLPPRRTKQKRTNSGRGPEGLADAESRERNRKLAFERQREKAHDAAAPS